MAAEELAEALRSLAESLRFYQAMGLKDLALTRDYFPTPEEALTRQEQGLQGCPRCKLSQGRTTIVFGSGNPRAELVCIGEAPGADEDAQGKPFVGRAGPLLTKRLEAVGFGGGGGRSVGNSWNVGAT